MIFTQLFEDDFNNKKKLNEGVHDEDCDLCNGTGEGLFDGESCHKCDGTGVMPSSRSDDDFDVPDDYDDNDYGDEESYYEKSLRSRGLGEAAAGKFQQPGVGSWLNVGQQQQATDDTPSNFSIVVAGRQGKDFQAITLAKALETILPNDYPRSGWPNTPGSDRSPTHYVIQEVLKRGQAIVKDGIGSKDVADSIAVKFKKYGIPAYVEGALEEGSMVEGTQTVGHEILGMLRQVRRQGDDAMEELYSSCPLLAQYWDEYEGDFRSMVIELPPETLARIKAEISAFNQQGVAEAKAATARFRTGNKKRAELNAMSDEERRAYDKEQQEKQRKRDDARLERERQKLADKKKVAEASFDYTAKDLGNDYAGFPSNHSLKHKFLAKIKPEKQQLYKDKMNNMHEFEQLSKLFSVAKQRGDIIEQGVAEATDLMAKERRKRLADAEKKKQERLAAEKAKKDKKQDVAETRAGNRMSDMSVGSPKVVYKGGKAVGEIGVDHEASPGNGPYYMKHYETNTSYSGYDTKKEALADLKHCIDQMNEGVGSDMAKLIGIPVVAGAAAIGAQHYDDQQPHVNIGGQNAKIVRADSSRIPSNAMTITGKDGKTYRVWQTSGKGMTKTTLAALVTDVNEADKKKDEEPEVRDVALQRAISRAKSDFPTAGSGIEALAKDFMRGQDQDQKAFDQMRQAERQQDQMLAQIDQIDQEQNTEIDNLENQNSTLTQRLQQLQNVNSQLEKKLASMSGRKSEKKSSATDISVAPALSTATTEPISPVAKKVANPKAKAQAPKSSMKSTAAQLAAPKADPMAAMSQRIQQGDSSVIDKVTGQKSLAFEPSDNVLEPAIPQAQVNPKFAAAKANASDVDPRYYANIAKKVAGSPEQFKAAMSGVKENDEEAKYSDKYQDMVARVGQKAREQEKSKPVDIKDLARRLAAIEASRKD